MTAAKRNWLREASSDENGVADAAFVSILGIAATLTGTVLFLCIMSAVSYARCIQIDGSRPSGVLTAPCVFDPQPLALGIAAAIGAFAAPIGALAGYMAATKRPPRPAPPPAPTLTVVQQNPPAPATPAAPMPS
jgi:hypothetical protein